MNMMSDYTEQTVVENMAFHGHVDCIKYAVQNGCEQRQVWYTQSTECLDYIIENNSDWQGGLDSKMQESFIPLRNVKLSICEEAAM
jgi:hypothetical protein